MYQRAHTGKVAAFGRPGTRAGLSYCGALCEAKSAGLSLGTNKDNAKMYKFEMENEIVLNNDYFFNVHVQHHSQSSFTTF